MDAYEAMIREYRNPWYYVREMFGDKCRKTVSDAGSLKIGDDDFCISIPNGKGDGTTRYAILENEDFHASHIMNYFAHIDGKFEIYGYDCGDDIREELNGSYSIYFYDGLIAFVKR